MNDGDLESYRALMINFLTAYQAVDELPDHLPAVKYPRSGWRRPERDENRYGAWYVKTSVKGAPAGRLSGRRIVLKDNICLAGVPMTGGASILEGYVPEIDASVAQRLLGAGAEIVGKAVCEYFSFSGGSHTSATGPVENPRKPGHSAGGSSSGCAALVAAGEVDMAIGGDQGGSIRIPSSFCGTYGMKPTYGLVPYTGIMSIEATLDHTGPITSNVADNALLLEVIAGPDGIDSRQGGCRTAAYTQALGQGASGLRIAVVREGFNHPNSEPVVDSKVKAAADQLKKLGAVVEEVSIPMHLAGSAVLLPILVEGALDLMIKGNGFGTNREGLHLVSLLEACAVWRDRADELSETLKLSMLLGQFLSEAHRGRFYAKAQNQRRMIRAAYDQVLDKYDLLLMPTLPITATPLPGEGAGREEIIQRAFEMLANTAQFDLTGHPAMSVPCGMSQGKPVGMMLIGKHFDEPAIYRAAHAYEESGDWQSR
jgi:amidase